MNFHCQVPVQCLICNLVAVHTHTVNNHHFVSYLATNCSVFSCQENEMCVEVNNIFTCIFKNDYEGPDCSLSKLKQFISLYIHVN